MADSLSGLNYSNPFKPNLAVAPNYFADYKQAYDASAEIWDNIARRKQQEQSLAAQQQRLAQEQQLFPTELQAAKDQAILRGNTISRIGAVNANQDVDFEQNKRALEWDRVIHPSGGYVNADGSIPAVQPGQPITSSGGINSSALPADSSPANPGALTGNTFTATGTGYHPVNPSSPDYKMEGGMLDSHGNKIFTLDAFRRGEAPYVTAAIDNKSPLYNKTVFSPTLNAPVKFSDYGGAFAGKGNSRVDIARDDNKGALSDENNGPIQFTLNGSPSSQPTPQAGAVAPVQPGQPIVAPDGIPTRTDQLATVGSQQGMIAKRLPGIMNASGRFIPGGQPGLPGDKMALRDVMVPSPALVKQHDGLLATARRLGLSTDYPRDENGLLSREDYGSIDKDIQEAKKVAATDTLYDPDTIESMAQIRVIDPSDPRGKIFGMGPKAAAARAQLDAKTSDILRSTGKTGAEAVVAYTGVSAAKKTIAAQEKSRAAILAFEQNARTNAKIALDLMDRGVTDGVGIPVIDRWIRAGRKATGDPEVAAFNTAIGDFQEEYAKIMSGNTGASGGSDAARRKAEEIINKGGTSEQLRAQFGVAFQGMEGRIKGIDEGLEALNQSIRDKEKPKGEAKESAPKPAQSSADSVPVGTIANQGGKRYQKQADGTWKPL